MKVAAVQHDIAWEDPPSTIRRVAPMVARAAGEGAGLILLSVFGLQETCRGPGGER